LKGNVNWCPRVLVKESNIVSPNHKVPINKSSLNPLYLNVSL